MDPLPNLVLLNLATPLPPLPEHLHSTHESWSAEHGPGVDLVADQMNPFLGYEIEDEIELVAGHRGPQWVGWVGDQHPFDA